MNVRNCAAFELSVFDLALITEGCAFEAVPVRLNLAPSALGLDTANIKLIGVPRLELGDDLNRFTGRPDD